jgi:ribosomal protein L21E
MATAYKVGDRVQVRDRSATADDVKSGLFYEHFRGLTGTVQNIYANDEAAVDVEPESLDDSVAKRHIEIQEGMKNKWLDGLSEEARTRLTDKERDFRLRYTVLVSMNDLTAPGGASTPAERSAAKKAAALQATQQAMQQAAPRATSADLAAAEEAELQRRLKGA